MASRAFSLNSIDWRKILIGLAMALLGALATYLLDKVVPIFNDQGDQWSLLLAALLAALANALRKYVTDSRLTLAQWRDLERDLKPQ